MLPSIGMKLLKSSKQSRSLAVTLISHCSKKNSLKQKPYELMELRKGVKKKPRRQRLILKKASDDIEALWLENLTSENLKLYRKTSFGSFRIINLDNLFEKLKEIYPTKFGNGTQEDDASFSSTVESETESCSEKAPPYLSDYVVKHIVEFPLLKKETNMFSEFAKDEIDDYGRVDSQMFPSVTAILNETMSEAAKARLKRWKERLIAELGKEGFSKYKKDLLAQGSKFHSTLKTYLEVPDKNLVTVDPVIEGCWKSLERLLPDISDVQFVEEFICHPVLMYRGIVDCVAAYRGTPCVIEWKKSEKRKPQLSDTYDAPLQLCAYLGALPWHKNVTVTSGLVVVAYTDGTPANIFELSLESCELYWMEWLRRVQSYWLKKSSIVVQDET